ncbi:TIR domain-containing protein [Sphingomicrobium marinum]|uniref:TIR domain-containing protein n=1 Tax=Sphingomicrobium marinum TaxID=1227950 RepID=UPI00224002BE|nr:TIR domain-containing protein [Sphingomicrobium marinum]
MADIFISYARADRHRVQQLASALEEEGFSVWWDDRIQSGAAFADDIEREIDAARAVLVCWSQAAAASRWVKDEANRGAEEGKLLSVTIDGTMPPLGFGQFHCDDMQHWHGHREKPAFQRLLAAIQTQLTGELHEPPRVKAPTRWRRFGVLALFSLLIFTGIGFALSGGLLPSLSGEAENASIAPPRVQVAPIEIADDDARLAAMAQGLRDDIASGLSRFSTLSVASPSTDDDKVDYRLAATLRIDGDLLRLSTRLIDIAEGEQVWGQTYDRDIEEQSAVALQDDLSAKVIAAVGDPYGAMLRNLQQSVAAKDPASLAPFEAVLRNSIYRQRLSPEDHLVTRAALEKAASQAPHDANVWASLAAVRIEEIKHHYNRRPDAGAKALEAARKAVRADPKNAYAYFELAEVQFFLKDLGAFRAAAERAYELNPYDSDAVAMLGILSGYAGDWDRGREWTARAMALNPDHPGWYRFSHFFDAYLDGRYEEALEIQQRVNQPEYFADPYTKTIVLVRLGRMAEARRAAADFERLLPGGLGRFRELHLDTWMFAQPRLQRMILEDLRAAGLDIP